MARKVAIVAKAATAAFAPYDDPAWEIWGMPWVRYQRTPDILFDLHSEQCWLHSEMPQVEQVEWVEYANTVDVPIYTHPTRLQRFKTAVAFPYAAVERLTSLPFFENTIAYQLGFALWSHGFDPIDEIGLYGVNMMGQREYLWERASVTYWTGVLEGRGIKVTPCPGSALFMSYWMAGRYGETAEKRFTLKG